VTFLEVDYGLRAWRKAVKAMARLFDIHAEVVLLLIDTMISHLHSGGSWDGYIGPERQLKHWPLRWPLLWPPRKSMVLINITGGKVVNGA
jgi:hypothetical protein